MANFPVRVFRAAALAAPALFLVGLASAQERSPGFLDNIFGGNSSAQAQSGRVAQMSEADLVVRLDRLEAQLRQLTGAVEQLQYRNQQLEQALQRTQGAQGAQGGQGAPPPVAAPQYRPPATGVPGAVGAPPPPAAPGRRSDAFDPNQNPTAPGAPQVLGSVPAASAPPPVGAPGGRAAGAPLDLSTLSGVATDDPSLSGEGIPGGGMLPPPPPRNPNATGAQMAAVEPPSQTPKDTFDLAIGYVKRKEYPAAEEGFRDFLRKYPSDRMVADAQYWLGESLYQRQRFRDAAESFLVVTTKYESSAKAPDALLRLGQSLAALGEKETACAAWGEIGRKYTRASASVKGSVAAEQKRVRC
jgi:tol-pal system protein YbgF